MRIIDTSGTTTFPMHKCEGFDAYYSVTRDFTFKDIDKLNSSENIGDDKNVTISFIALTRTELNTLNTIFVTNKGNNSSITQIDNYDEVAVGENWDKYDGNVFIETKQFPRPKKSIKSPGKRSMLRLVSCRLDLVPGPSRAICC